MGNLFQGYAPELFFDEMFNPGGGVRSHYEKLLARYSGMSSEEFQKKRNLADNAFLTQGVTFTVYNDLEGTERIFPFDLIPRIIPRAEWEHVERGLSQRITALNLFLHDIYHDQKIVRDGIIPGEIIRSAAHFRPEFMGFDVPKDIYIHICGSDLIRDQDGNYLVLETKGKDTDQDRTKREFLGEWVNAVNAHGGFGSWSWDVSKHPADLKDIIARHAVSKAAKD